MRDKVYKNIAITKIIPNSGQPRTIFNEEKIEELAESIKQNGLLQPIIVRKYNGKYQIIAGERRYRACQLAGLKEIPCLISRYTDQQMDTLAIIENIQREDLSVIEEAKAYQTLMQLYNYSQSKLAEKVGKRQSTIANKIRLLKLSEPVLEALNNNEITERHGRAMLHLDAQEQKEVLEKITKEALTVKQTEELIAAEPVPEKPKKVKGKNKSISQNVKIAVNTLKQAIAMIEKTGISIEEIHEDQDEEYIITIKVKK